MNHRTWGRASARPRTAAGLLAAACSLLAVLAAPTHAAVLTATPSTLDESVAEAQGGDVVALGSGDYGTFSGASKSGMVTLRAQPGAAPTMEINWNSVANLRVEGATITGASITGSTHDVTIANSHFTGMAVIRADQLANANIVFDGNTHAGINVCGNCSEGRLQVSGRGSQPSGIVVRNSVFGPGGDADGMQIGGNGVQVLNNEFVGIRQVSAVHSDALQLYGQSNTLIRGNYFHDNDVAIMAPDGGTSEVISDNVFVGGGEYRPAVQLGSHIGTQFVHNTVRNLDVHMDRKSENPDRPSRDGVIRDNVFVNGTIGGMSTNSSYCSNCDFSYNLFSRGGVGAAALTGTAVFAGGANPTTYAGHVLAAGSPGKGTASDGSDRGIRLQPGGAAPAPTGAVPGASRPANGAIAGARLKAPRRVSWARLRHGLRVRVRAAEPVRVVLRLSRKRNGKALARKVRQMPVGRHRFVLRVRPGRHHARKVFLMVRMTNAAGETSVLRRKIRIGH